jgi:copper homeostasis protein CutC
MSLYAFAQRRLEYCGNLTDDGITPLGSGVISKGCLYAAVPRQEIINPVDGMKGGFGRRVVNLNGADVAAAPAKA